MRDDLPYVYITDLESSVRFYIPFELLLPVFTVWLLHLPGVQWCDLDLTDVEKVLFLC